jgi:uncharacterized membrane protein
LPRVFVALAPWIVFAAVAKAAGWEAGAAAALIAAVILTYPTRDRGPVKAPEIAALAVFALLVILGLRLDRAELGRSPDLAVAVVTGLLALILLASLAFTPIAEQYAREQAPEEELRKVGFRHTHRHLTVVWGLVFALVAVLALVQDLTGARSDLLTWIVPVTAVLACFKYHLWYVAEVETFAEVESSVGPATAAAQRF